MRLHHIIAIFISFLFALKISSQELYRYTDEQGNEYIVDSPHKLPLSVKNRDKYIKEYEKKKKEEYQLPPDLQDNRPAYNDINIKTETNTNTEDTNTEEDSITRKKSLLKENNKKIEELKKQLEDTVNELGYKSQRALITQIPSLKEEVERLKAKVEEIKQELNKYYEQADKIEKQ